MVKGKDSGDGYWIVYGGEVMVSNGSGEERRSGTEWEVVKDANG